MKYLSAVEFGKKLGVGRSRINQLIRQGRIPAKTVGGVYIIPANAKDPRKANGRPRKDD